MDTQTFLASDVDADPALHAVATALEEYESLTRVSVSLASIFVNHHGISSVSPLVLGAAARHVLMCHGSSGFAVQCEECRHLEPCQVWSDGILTRVCNCYVCNGLGSAMRRWSTWEPSSQFEIRVHRILNALG